jgi:hypothetical protein
MFVWTPSIKRRSPNRTFSRNPVIYTVKTIFPFGRVSRNAWAKFLLDDSTHLRSPWVGNDTIGWATALLSHQRWNSPPDYRCRTSSGGKNQLSLRPSMWVTGADASSAGSILSRQARLIVT